MTFETNANIQSRSSSLKLNVRFLITPRLSDYQPENKLDINNWQLPRNVKLADEFFNLTKPIDMLLGSECFFEVLRSGQIKLGEDLPILQETALGWVVSGRYRQLNQAQNKSCFITNVQGSDEDLNRNLEYLWELENVQSVRKTWSDEEQACENHFISNTSLVNNQVVVKLPFKESPESLGDSYNSALKRLHSLERRLRRDPELKIQYENFLKEYEALGHMSLLKTIDFDKPHYFIPHQGVIKLNSTSTKLRVVFDASSRTSSGKSMNEILKVGPTIQDELYIQLLRFRTYKFALSADIVKMYRMILIHPEDRKYQLILWRNNETESVKIYQLNTVTYGMSASPFLAIRSLKFLADKFEAEFPIAANILRNNFYVDDMLTGANTIEHLQQIKLSITELLDKGGCKLAKFQSNAQLLRSDLPNAKSLNIDEPLTSNALGIDWDPVSDSFLFKYQPKKHYVTITKRSILSLSSSIFDPMGLLAPIIIKPRVLLQDLWIAKIDWDCEVPKHTEQTFKNFISDLENLHIVKIPRYVIEISACNVQLHGFSDASMRAYGACMYVRMCDERGNIQVNLFTSKVRVAPVKKRTMPQLELCGAHLLAQLYRKIIVVFENIELEVFLWVDSTTVLNWLTQHSSNLPTFVGNRVSDIQDLTTDCCWKYVPTSVNPADIVSRGCSVNELIVSNWFTGPDFLRKMPIEWPTQPLNQCKISKNENLNIDAVLTCTMYHNSLMEFIERTSSYTKLLRVMTWILKFCKRFKSGIEFNNNNNFDVNKLNHALHSIIWIIQSQYFATEITCLQKNCEIRNSLKSLGLFLENVNGFILLRVGGRLVNSDMPRDQKHPFLLPSSCNFVKVLVRHIHVINYHAGPKALLSFVRQRFWIVNCRALARKTVKECISCIKYKPILMQQIMGDLPSERVTVARPFEKCGVDFCGPVNTYLKIRGKRPYKCYIAIFVCFTVKAVHIEAVSDLSSNAFIAALKRFIGRRGLPTDIFCDNATNFVGAQSQMIEFRNSFLNQAYHHDILNFCSIKLINFHFIPPRAPHFGGLWEAAVKSTKGHLFRTLANATLTYEELTTALIEIEQILNSQPILMTVKH